jgi:hypothetical protein
MRNLSEAPHLAIKGELQKAFREEGKEPEDETQGKAQLSNVRG